MINYVFQFTLRVYNLGIILLVIQLKILYINTTFSMETWNLSIAEKHHGSTNVFITSDENLPDNSYVVFVLLGSPVVLLWTT